MQTIKQQGQAAKGSAPLAFQLSSPPKLARQNVLAAVRPQAVEKGDAAKGLSESSSAASGKSRSKKSRWGPDQLATSPPPTSGQAPLPALGFKGVNSHRPPGLLLPPKPGTSAGLATAKPASEDHGTVTQPDPGSHRPPNSITVEQPVARTQKDAEVAQRSLPGQGSHSTSSEGKTASQVPHASSSSSRLPSDRERSRETQGGEVADHHRATPSPGAAAHRKRMRAPSVENGHTEARPRARSRDRAVSRSPAVRAPHKHTRHSDEYRKCRHAEAEGRLHISPAGSDGLPAETREQRSNTVYRRESSEGRTSNGAQESDRRRGSHMSRNLTADKGRPRSRSPAAGSRRPREPRHRSPSHEEEGQLVERSAGRSQKLSASDHRQPYRKLDMASAHQLPQHASAERSKHSAPVAAAAPVAEGKAAVGLQQADLPDQPMHSSADPQQVQAAPVSDTQCRPQQVDPAVIAVSAMLPTVNTNADATYGRAAHPASAPPADLIKHADADTQQSQSVTQQGGHRRSDVQAPKHCIIDLPEESGQRVPAFREDQKVTAAGTYAQGSSHRAVTPSGSRPASQQQQQHPRRRREFHDEPMPSGPGLARKRSQTPEVEFVRDAKRSRHAWHPTPAHAGHAEHRMPSQGAPRHEAHRGPNAFTTKQGDGNAAVSNYRYRDSQSPTPRSVGRGPVAGRHADTTRSMSRSPSHANSRNALPGHLHGGAPGPHTAPHGRTWGADKLYYPHSRGNAPQASFAPPPRFDRQQDQQLASWSNRDYNRGSLLSHDNGHYKDHDRDFDRRSRSSDRGTCGKDMSRQRQPSASEHEAAALSRAQKLDSDLDHMFAGLLKAFKRGPDAVGNKLVLQQISSSVRLTEHIDGGGDDDEDEDKPGFMVTRQSLPGWLHGAERQQLQKMLVPADWLTQDPQFQPRQRLPLGWCPPECTRESICPSPELLDDPRQDVTEANGTLCEGNPATIPWQAEEAEAGEVAQDSKDPRASACTALQLDIVMPMPLFPFLPEGEAPLSMCDISPDHGPARVEGGKGEKRVDQLAPGGFLYDYWDLAHRPPSPTGSWSTTPTPTPHSGWGAESGGAWGPSAHLEPPAAPTHFTNTEQPYVEHVTTTALPHGSELTDQHSRMAAGHPLDVHQQQLYQRQQLSPPLGHPRPPQTPPTPQLWRPAYYPEPESAYYRLQFGDRMSAKDYGLVQLRQEMAQGREDARPGTSLQNKAEGYWIPLQQARWKPEQLHWEGIDQMVMQGASPSSEGLDATPIDSESQLDAWLAETAESSQQRLHPQRQPSQQAESLTEDLSSPAVVGNTGLEAGSPTNMSQASSATDLFPEALWASHESSEQWFASHVAFACKASTGAGSEGQSDPAHAGRKARCWGPPPPPQYPAMLRGELALAVMTGVAGKSLLKEVLDRAINQQLIRTKVQ